jgi:hypothetical protein
VRIETRADDDHIPALGRQRTQTIVVRGFNSLPARCFHRGYLAKKSFRRKPKKPIEDVQIVYPTPRGFRKPEGYSFGVGDLHMPDLGQFSAATANST